MNTDPKTEAILHNYRQGVEKLARGVYLKAISIKNELDDAKINPEDRLTVLMHVVNLLTGEKRPAQKNNDTPQ
jgi:hypothetical protein